jgi:hypothetical protein
VTGAEEMDQPSDPMASAHHWLACSVFAWVASTLEETDGLVATAGAAVGVGRRPDGLDHRQ